MLSRIDANTSSGPQRNEDAMIRKFDMLEKKILSRLDKADGLRDTRCLVCIQLKSHN